MTESRLSVFVSTLLLAGLMVSVALWAPLRSQASSANTVLRPYRFVPIHLSQTDEEAIFQKWSALVSSLRSVDIEDLLTPGLTQSPHDKQFSNLEEAKSFLGNGILVPTYVPTGIASKPSLSGLTPGTATVALKTKGIRQMLAAMSLNDVQVPDTYEGAKVTLETWPVVVQVYTSADQSQGFIVAQTHPPALTVDAKVDVEALRRQLITSIAPPEVAAQLLAIEDWTTTLPVPVPEGVTSKYVDTGGNPALVLSDPHHRRTLALWFERGDLLVVGGNLSEDEVVRIVMSLR